MITCKENESIIKSLPTQKYADQMASLMNYSTFKEELKPILKLFQEAGEKETLPKLLYEVSNTR